MPDHRIVIPLLIALLALLPDSPFAQDQPPAEEPGAAAKSVADRNGRRLFERFVEDAAIIPGGWIELQYTFENFDGGERHILGPLVAFKIATDVEGGVRFGWQDVNSDALANGNGLTDVDLYAKYRFAGKSSRAAVGGLVKLPAADEENGLGTGKPDFELFAAWRADLEGASLVANAGVSFNGDPDPPQEPSEDTLLIGGAIILPPSPLLTIVIEATFETARIEGAEDDARLTLGFQKLRKKGRGGFRSAVAIPLSDGAPDYQVFAGLFMTY